MSPPPLRPPSEFTPGRPGKLLTPRAAASSTKAKTSTAAKARSDTIDLCGAWQIRADPDDAGLGAEWWMPSGRPADGWQEITVPSAWQTVLGMRDPDVAWYRRTVSLPRSWLAGHPGERIWLRFEAVATHVHVWVNGVDVGEHLGDWAPFQFDITDAVASPGEEEDTVEIVARVDKVRATPAVWIDGAPVFGGNLTKGFHNVVSAEHGGIWDDVRLFRTGETCAEPDGVSIIGDVKTGEVNVSIELARSEADATADLKIEDNKGKQVGQQKAKIPKGSTTAAIRCLLEGAAPWSPSSPTLYTARLVLKDAHGTHEHTIRFGFRHVQTGGTKNIHLLLNGAPIFLRGVLDWGHEPRHIAPAPRPDELRDRFAELKRRGFNCVCICMWYPPRHFYDIADEMGMLIWQEHPVWKPPMSDEHIDEYQRNYTKFFRRDANHPSVVLVSGSCEHERFNPRLADWWWKEARRRMPERALQIQTAFFAWTDPEKTDLWDEHTYESAGRWARYLDDLQAALAEKPAKPFVMGESILYTSWPDIAALESVTQGGGLPAPSPRPAAPSAPRHTDRHDKRLPILAETPDLPNVTILRWRQEEGVHLVEGDTVAILETDLNTYELRAPATGVLRHECADISKVSPGTRVGWIVTDSHAGGASSHSSSSAPSTPSPAAGNDSTPAPPSTSWWLPKGLGELARFERDLEEKYGADIARRFRTHGERYHLLGRKFQVERLRSYPNHAGVVMNHLRDVPQCRCGFQDDLGRWRFAPEDLTGFMADAPLLFWTPDHRRAFFGGGRLDSRVALSNFSGKRVQTQVDVSLGSGASGPGAAMGSVSLDVAAGAVKGEDFPLGLSEIDHPARLTVAAKARDSLLYPNAWDLWLLPVPRAADPASGVYRLWGIDFVDARDQYPDFEEHKYSSGWGLPVKNWVCVLPDPARLRPDLATWSCDQPIPDDARVLLTHRFTEQVVEFLVKGGRVVHTASKGPGSLPTKYVSMWGQVPLILCDQALGFSETENDAVLDLLDYDLTRRLTRAAPTGELGIEGMVEPAIRLVWTHDMQERPKVSDCVFIARVGKGLLVVSTLDHSEDAGQWLLGRLIEFATNEAAESRADLDPAVLRRWTAEASQR